MLSFSIFMSNIIDGKYLSNEIISNLKEELNTIQSMNTQFRLEHHAPGLAVIQVGNKLESSIYIKKKSQACSDIGFYSEIHNLDLNISNEDIILLINDLNNNTKINGILVQLPLPEHLNESKIMNKIAYSKDVDGFHVQNMGELAMTNRDPMFIPCTPLGCLKIFEYENIKLSGKHVVVIGKSNIVGLPIVLLLLKAMATVTVCHKDTENIQLHTKQADIIISACGQPEMIKKDWLKDGVIVIDIGTNFIADSNKKNGKKLVGDVDFNEVKDIAHKITPVPGGVGPLTVAMLLSNTMKAFKLQNDLN